MSWVIEFCEFVVLLVYYCLIFIIYCRRENEKERTDLKDCEQCYDKRVKVASRSATGKVPPVNNTYVHSLTHQSSVISHTVLSRTQHTTIMSRLRLKLCSHNTCSRAVVVQCFFQHATRSQGPYCLPCQGAFVFIV